MIGSREGELAPDEVRALAGHLAGCAPCRAREVELRRTEGLVAEALLARASRRDFGPFVDGVMERIAAGRARSPLARLRDWALGHRRAAVLATAGPVLAALALLVYVRAEHAPELALVELDTVGNVSIVLRTEDGPLVLLRDAEPEDS
ncbi:MAG TPA: zf-HC2 domain-containing protein [Anaeromyxobacteraceae bacterium]|nr:zf-HC2 domain-containing protein [Anaeromyxobacteraceae bacterium]